MDRKLTTYNPVTTVPLQTAERDAGVAARKRLDRPRQRDADLVAAISAVIADCGLKALRGEHTVNPSRAM